MLAPVVLLLLAIELLDELVFGARGAAFPAIQDDLELSYAEIGLLLAVPNVASAVVEPVVGILGDVWRRHVLVVGGGIAFAVGLALTAASGSFWPLLVAFVVLYPASGAFVSLSQASLMDQQPEARERNMVRWTLAGSAGGFAGPLIVGAFVFLDAGWRPVFVVLAGVALVLALGATRIPARAHAERPSFRAGFVDAGRALRRRGVLRWLALLEASDLLLDVFVGFVALYLADEAGLSAGAAALALSVWVGADFVGNVVTLRVLHRTTGPRYLRASALAGGVLFSAFLLVPGAPAKLALLAALGVTTAAWYPLLKARFYEELPGRSGTAMALSAVTDPVGALPPLAIGFLAESYGLDVALWLLLIAPFALLLLVPRDD